MFGGRFAIPSSSSQASRSNNPTTRLTVHFGSAMIDTTVTCESAVEADAERDPARVGGAPVLGDCGVTAARNWTTTTCKVPILQFCAGTRRRTVVGRMGCPRERAAVANVFIMALLFLLAGQAGVVCCHPSPTVAVKHQAAHVRKPLNNTTSAAGGNFRGAAAVAVAYAVSAPDLCSEEVVEVFQDNAGSLPNGVPSYSVTITNTCMDCTVCDVHVSCGEFASTELVDPSDFRRLSYGDCLVRNGGPIGPGETISFEYSNSFIYQMDVATVSCVDI